MKKEEINKKDIAIIGISCKFPQSNNPDEFWKNLVEQKELLHFYTDEELSNLGINHELIANPNYIKVNADLENIGSFDYSFFGYTKDEANCMDPQTRALHEQVWLAFEDAGYDISSYKEKVGVYVSMSDNLNWVVYNKINPNKNVNSFYQQQLLSKNFAHTLLSYNLDLKGPSYLIDTACSSSLSSIHIACRNLLLRECSMALAAGISIDSTKNKGYIYQEGMISSKDGHCKAFDEKSSGTIAGNGGAVIVLKRLEDAVRDKDHIYAVIKSSAVNNDGKGKVGYTAPSVIGQSDCIKLAHKTANVPSNTISYIEAHGTGTKLGDPIEIEALNKAFNYDTTHKCAVGSVKTNMGHLDAAAGIAGLVKTALAINKKQIPATLHFTKPNPEINFKSGPFYVNAQLQEWKNNGEHPLRAGVSSFGIGGTNVHIVMEEAPVLEKSGESRPYQLLVYSAKTKSSLSNYQASLNQFLQTNENIDLADLAYTLQVGRKSFAQRDFVVFRDKKEALYKLKEQVNTAKVQLKRNIVFMFSGQGSQYFNMAKDVYLQEQDFRVLMDKGFQILKDLTGENYKAIIGYENDDTIDPLLINKTQYTQPLLFLIEYAFASLLLNWGISPKYMIGHSLGEYVAACISGVFSFEDALYILVKRSSLMSKVEEGEMLEIGLTYHTIKPYINNEISVAALNTKNSTVVSGNKNDIEELIKVLVEKNIAYNKLKTSHAFHSKMMDVILDDYENELSKINLSKPERPFISNLTGKEISQEEAVSPKYWVKHLRETVNFSDGIDYLLEKGNSVFIEVGPGKALSTFCQLNKNYKGNNLTVGLIRHPKEIKNDNQKLVESLGYLWSTGVDIKWSEYYAHETRNKMAAPTYSFDKHVFVSNVNPFEKLADFGVNNDKKAILEWFYEPSWKTSRLVTNIKNESTEKYYLVFMDDLGYGEALVQKIRKESDKIIEVRKGERFKKNSDSQFELNSSDYSTYEKLFLELKNQKIKLTNIIHLFNIDEVSKSNSDKEENYKELGFYSLLHIAKNINDLEQKEVLDLTVVTSNLQTVLGNENTDSFKSMTLGLINVITQENPLVNCRNIDVLSTDDKAEIAENIAREIQAKVFDKFISYRLNSRWVRSYNPIQIENPQGGNTKIKKGGIYLITGGLGDLGFVHAKYLLEKYNASLILLGRTVISSTAENKKQGNYSRLKTLEQLGNVQYYNADINNLEDVQKVIQQGELAYGQINGIIHTAGIIKGKSLRSINFLKVEDCEKQFEPKVEGVQILAKIFKDRELDFCLFSSSLSSILGGKEFASYAAANTFMDYFSHTRKISNSISVNYDGLNFEENQKEGLLTSSNIIEVFERILSIENIPQIIISTSSLDKRLSKWVGQLETNPAENFENSIEIASEEFDRSGLTNKYTKPDTPVEKKLSELFEEFFGYKDIGIEDDFFELGGNSLMAITLSNRIYKLFNVELAIEDFFVKPNIKELAKEIDMVNKLIDIQKNNKEKKYKIEI
jgi:phthiocerol/phenolphthiocerol synthesis type-I polyketide synthase E